MSQEKFNQTSQIKEKPDSKVEPMSLDEIKNIIKEFDEKERKISSKKEKPIRERFLEKSQLLDEMIKDLIDHKEKFRNIFYTEKGSVYFVLNSGETLRIKRVPIDPYQDQNETMWKIEPMTNNIFFIDEDMLKEIQKYFREKYTLAEIPIKVSDIKEESYVLEVGLEYDKEYDSKRYNLNLNNDILLITDNDSEDNDIPASPLFHLGHKVTEIIK